MPTDPQKRINASIEKKDMAAIYLLFLFVFTFVCAVLYTTYAINKDNQQALDTLAIADELKQTCPHQPCFLYEIENVHELHHDTVTFYVKDYNDADDLKQGIMQSAYTDMLTLTRDHVPRDIYTLVGQFVFVYENREGQLQLDIIQP